MPASLNNTTTGNAVVNGLMSPVRWDTLPLTFSFPTSATFYEQNYGGTEPATGFLTLNASMIAASRAALAAFAEVSGLQFTELTESTTVHADLRSAYYTPGPAGAGVLAHAYYPADVPRAGDAWYNNDGVNNLNAVKGNNDYATVIHELGHALGLKHPHEADGAFPVLATALDYGDYTVMSYRSVAGGALSALSNETFGYSQTPMMLDIAALQAMYGANYTTRAGNTTYSWSATTGEMSIDGVGQGAAGANRISMTVWDGNGIDTYDLSNYTTALSVDLSPGGWSTFSQDQLAKLVANGSALSVGNVANAMLFNNDARSLIENVIGGTGNDAMLGNAAHNNLRGGLGSDLMAGGAGADTLDGGDGIDTASYALEVGSVSTNLFIGVAGTADGAFDTLISIENLVGGSAVDFINGNNSDNSIQGGDGGDLLWSYGGNDTILGQGGNDVVAAGTENDQVSGGDGNDWLYGEGGADLLVGDAPALGGFDVMIGGEGDDSLDGGIGGFDYFYGGDGATGGGNDTYLVSANSGFKVMNDFEAGGVNDAVRLAGTALTSFAQVQGNLSFSGVVNGMVLVVDGGTQIWFANVGLGQLTAADFIFA